MCIRIVPIEERVSAPEHVDDAGPPTVWKIYLDGGLYAVIDGDSNTPVGIIEVSGLPDLVKPGWWLDSRVRGKGLGNKMVDVLAEYLKKLGCTGVGNIPIQTRNQVYDKASSALAKRFRAHFGA